MPGGAAPPAEIASHPAFGVAEQMVLEGVTRMFSSRIRQCRAGAPALAIVLLQLPLAVALRSAQDSPPTAPEIIIADGTRVELRFAQEVRGRAAGQSRLPLPGNVPGEIHPGDAVRLVVVENARVEGRVVIARGATAQATVTDVVTAPYSKDPSAETGLFLRLDWILTMNDVEVPARAFKKGPSGRFYAQVWPAGSGTVIRPMKLKPWLLKVPNFDTSEAGLGQTGLGKRNWIPAGTRMTAFVRGPMPLDRAQIERAQSRLPANGLLALLTMYRTKDRDDQQLAVSCDGQRVAEIGERQYATLELAPGEHRCQVEQEKPLVITAVAGEEYYGRLRRGAFAGWELKLVPATEGEEAISTGELVIPKAAVETRE